jgi:hypothetical protein
MFLRNRQAKQGRKEKSTILNYRESCDINFKFQYVVE